MTQKSKGPAEAATSPGRNSNHQANETRMNSAPISTIIQFIEDSFLRQITYWEDQRDHAEDNTPDEAVSLLNDLIGTTDIIDADITRAFSALWDSMTDPEEDWADLLKSIGVCYFPDEAEGVLREFLEVVSGGGA